MIAHASIDADDFRVLFAHMPDATLLIDPYDPSAHELLAQGYELVARVLRDVGIWGTMLITIYSGLTYVTRAMALFRQPTERPA